MAVHGYSDDDGDDMPRRGRRDDYETRDEVREDSVPHKMEILEIESDRFAKLASAFEERLHNVLAPDRPHDASPGDDRAEPRPKTSPLAEQIQTRIDHFRITGARFDQILRRLDI